MATVEVAKSVPFYFVMDMTTMKYRKKDEEWVNSFHMAMRHQSLDAAEKVKAILTQKGNKNLRIVKHTLMLTVLEDEAEVNNIRENKKKEAQMVLPTEQEQADADAKRRAYFAKRAYFANKNKKEGNNNGK